MLFVFLVLTLASLLIAGAGRLLEPTWAVAPLAAIVLNVLLGLWGSAAFTYELLGAVRMSKSVYDYTPRQQQHDKLKLRWLLAGLGATLTLLLPIAGLGWVLGWGTGWILGAAHATSATYWIGLAYLLPLTFCSLPMLTVAFASLRQLAAELYGK